ncbi:hypothetical protein Scep_004699 [Stephania cephalantha]|uniref:Uncharacterized protein n=1 Tax=Stephania cephalantha TaxID=152367 RepID=A0AAP0PWV4_9MAGN
MEILEVTWFNFVVQVWSLVRKFDQPQRYKPFVSRCVLQGGVNIGSVGEVNVNEEEHILGIRIVGGDHRLRVNIASMVYFQQVRVAAERGFFKA